MIIWWYEVNRGYVREWNGYLLDFKIFLMYFFSDFRLLILNKILLEFLIEIDRIKR